MFKKVKHPDFIVGHRLKGANTKRDPLLDEKVGSNKRSRDEDGSSSVVYKETLEERKARLKAEKEAEKELRDAQKGKKKQALGPSKASILGLPDEQEEQAEEAGATVEPPVVEKQAKTKVVMSHKDMKILNHSTVGCIFICFRLSCSRRFFKCPTPTQRHSSLYSCFCGHAQAVKS